MSKRVYLKAEPYDPNPNIKGEILGDLAKSVFRNVQIGDLGIAPLALGSWLLLAAGSAVMGYFGYKSKGIVTSIGATLDTAGKRLKSGGPWFAGAIGARILSKHVLPPKYKVIGKIGTVTLIGVGTYKMFKMSPGEKMVGLQAAWLNDAFMKGKDHIDPITPLGRKLRKAQSEISIVDFNIGHAELGKGYKFILKLKNKSNAPYDLGIGLYFALVDEGTKSVIVDNPPLGLKGRGHPIALKDLQNIRLMPNETKRIEVPVPDRYIEENVAKRGSLWTRFIIFSAADRDRVYPIRISRKYSMG